MEFNSSLNSSLVKSLLEDGQSFNNGTEEENLLAVPQWFISLYFVALGISAVVNFLYVVVLLFCKRNGTLSIILQLSFTDCLLLYVAITEILAVNQQSWTSSTNSCPFFKGTEILANSLIIYLIICLNFHIISLWNLHKWEVQKSRRNPLTTCDDDSNECLVTRHENANRAITIDYRKRQNDVSIILPTILIWCLCLSLSIPNFTLSSTLRLNDSNILCAIIDNYYGKVLQYLLVVFRIVIPLPLLVFSLILLLYKLSQTSQKDIDNVLTKRFDEIRILLLFCINLTVLYLIASLQRLILYLITISYHFTENHNGYDFKLPPLYNSFISNSTTIYLAMLHYSCSGLRGFLYFYMLPKFRELLFKKALFFRT